MIKKIILAVLILATIMFAEYRYIMPHICPYKGFNGTVYLEIFSQVDEYEIEPLSKAPWLVPIENKYGVTQMKNPSLYITYPMPFVPITWHKGKVPKNRKAKKSDVPPMYRKNIWLQIRNKFSNNQKFKI